MQFSGFIFSDIRNLNSYRTPGRHLSPRRLLVESHPIGPDVPPSVKPLCCFLRSNIMVLNHFFNDIFCVLIILIRGLPQPLQGFLVILLDDIPLEIKDPDIIHCNFITGIRSPLIPFLRLFIVLLDTVPCILGIAKIIHGIDISGFCGFCIPVKG